jgi:hypothetical protein
MDDFARAALTERRVRATMRRRALLVHVAVYLTTNVFLFVVWLLTGAGHPWFLYVLFGWAIGLAAHAAAALWVTDRDDLVLEQEERRLRST